MKLLRMLLFGLFVLLPAVAWTDSLKVTPSEIELGNLKEGPPVVKKVVLTNTGTGELAIGNVKAS